MRKIYSHLTPALSKYYNGSKNVAKSEAFVVDTYLELTKIIAKLSYLNKDHLLFFRGQSNDYKSKNGSSTFYPTIYRDDYLQKQDLDLKFSKLEVASRLLVDKLKSENIEGSSDIKKRKLIQWSVLQHYEVIDTPLIDVTQSLRVACSFALLKNNSKKAFIYVFGLPYYNNRISHNSEHDLVNIRLLSIAPPDALRPYLQEGFLVGTEDITTEYENKGELDLNNRLIAKFEIPISSSFWGQDFSIIPESALYPANDKMENICEDVKSMLMESLEGSSIGTFLKLWSILENNIVTNAKKENNNVFTLLQALRYTEKRNIQNEDLLKEIDTLRRFRNKLVHKPFSVSQTEIDINTRNLNKIIDTYNHTIE